MTKIHCFCDLLSFLGRLAIFNGRYLKKLEIIWIFRIFEKNGQNTVLRSILRYKREGEISPPRIWVIFKSLRLLRGHKYEKVRSVKHAPKPIKKLRVRICGLGPYFRAIWAQNLDFLLFWWFGGLFSKEFRLVMCVN